MLCPSVIPTALQFVQICLQWRQNTTGTWIDFRNANILLAKKNESLLGAISIDPEHRLSAAWMPSHINSTMPFLDIQTVQNWAMLAAVEVWCKQCNYAVSSDAICWSADLLHHEAIIWDLQIQTFVSRGASSYRIFLRKKWSIIRLQEKEEENKTPKKFHNWHPAPSPSISKPQ